MLAMLGSECVPTFHKRDFLLGRSNREVPDDSCNLTRVSRGEVPRGESIRMCLR